MPATFAIAANGVVTAKGATVARHRVSMVTLGNLERLASSVRFTALAPATICPHTLPDFAYRWVRQHTAKTTERVQVRGTCVPRFNRLYSALSAAVGSK